MAWLRLYDDILDDPKVQMLSDRAFRMFINCLALAKRNDGKISGDLATLAFSLRQPLNKVSDTLQALLSARLLDRNGDDYSPHNWDGRQFTSDGHDKTAAERMRRYRARNPVRNGRNVTAESNAPLTVLDTDTDTDTDTEKKKEDAPQAALPPSKPFRGTRWKADEKVPEDWIREGEMRRLEHGLTPINLAVEAECFANYWASKTGKDAAKINWHMTWMNRAIKAEGPRNGRRNELSPHDKGTLGAAMFIAEAEARERAGRGNGAGTPRDCLPANGHGFEEMAAPIRDILRRSEQQEPGGDPLRLPALSAKRGQ